MSQPSAAVPIQFDDASQQREAATLGMWVFLAAEAIFFGGVLVCYAAYSFLHAPGFARAANLTNAWIGAINTGVLLTSSWTMALAVHAARSERRRPLIGLLAATAVLGTVFLAFKGVEYYQDYVHHLIPGRSFRGEPTAELFFSFYFVMTGIHALHLIIGIVLLLVLAAIAARTRAPLAGFNVFENCGLYWHFVDIVWIFLFPVLYLPGRHV